MKQSMALSICANEALLRRICEYQDGVYGDLMPNYRKYKESIVTKFQLHFPRSITWKTTSQFVLFDAMSKGHVYTMQRILRCRDIAFVSTDHKLFNMIELAMNAIKHEQLLLEFIQFLHQIGSQEFTILTMNQAVLHGCGNVVRYLHENRTEGCTKDAMNCAASKGYLDIVKYLHEHRHEGCSTDAMDHAAGNGHIDVVKFLHEHRTEGCTNRAMDKAAERGYLDIVIFLHENRTEGCTTQAMDTAAKYGHLNVVQFLHENRTEGCTAKAMNMAAAQGHYNIVEFLHCQRNEGCTRYAMKLAAQNGYLEIVQFLHENRTEGVTKQALYQAALHGHLGVVKYLHKMVVNGNIHEEENMMPETQLNYYACRRSRFREEVLDFWTPELLIQKLFQIHPNIIEYFCQNNMAESMMNEAIAEATRQHAWSFQSYMYSVTTT